MISFTNLFSSALILISSLYLACASLSFFISASISSGVCFLGLAIGSAFGFSFFFSWLGFFSPPLLFVAQPSSVN